MSDCKTCSAPNATLPPNVFYGECQCKAGYVPGSYPCTRCANKCPFCTGYTAADCVFPAENEFITTISSIYGAALPVLTEANSKFCYRLVRPTGTCAAGTAIENVVSSVTNYGTIGSAVFSAAQCRTLLTARWPFVTHWFAVLFPDFKGPELANTNDILRIKSILQLWILQFDPKEMMTWNAIRDAMVTPGDWKNYHATVTQFSVDNKVSYTNFPPVLSAWINGGCGGANCPDLEVFNVRRSECNTGGCTSQLQSGYCTPVLGKNCGT